MDESNYKLVVGLYLQNKASAGMRAFSEQAAKLKKDTKGLQEQLDKLRMNVGGARSAQEAQQKLLGLAKQEAAIREKLALSTSASANRQYKTELDALKLVKAEYSLKAQEYSAAETAQRHKEAAALKDQADMLRASRQWDAERTKQAQSEDKAQRAADNAYRNAQRQIEAADKLASKAQLKADIEARAQARSQQQAAHRASGAFDDRLNMAAFIAGPVASGGTAMIRDAVRGAADLQSAMVTIRNATVNPDMSATTPAQMEAIRQKAFAISSLTAQSVTDSARILAVMASSGINDPKKLLAIAEPMAKFADVQYLARGTSFEEATKQGIQLAHLYGRYSGAPLQKMLDSVTKISFMMPDNLNRFVTQAGYYMPAFRRLGVSDDQSFIAGAFLDRMGLGRGKGGAGLQNFIMDQMQTLALTKHSQTGKKKALEGLGLLNGDGSSKFYKDGHFDILGSLAAIDMAIQKRTKGLKGHTLDLAQGQAVTDIQSALGITGGRIGFLGETGNIAQLHDMIRQLKTMPGVDDAQARYMNTLNGQFKLFTSNFGSFLTELMWPWLKDLQSIFAALAKTTHDIQAFLHQHRSLEKIVGIGALEVIGGSIGLVMVQLWRLNAAILNLGTSSVVAGGEMSVATVENLSFGASLLAMGKAAAFGFLQFNKWILVAYVAYKAVTSIFSAFKQGQNVFSVYGTLVATQMHSMLLLAQAMGSALHGDFKSAARNLGQINDNVTNGSMFGYDNNFKHNAVPKGHTGSIHGAKHITIKTSLLLPKGTSYEIAEAATRILSRKVTTAMLGSGILPSSPVMSPSQVGFQPGFATG